MKGAFQSEVYRWLIACFGPTIATDKVERNHRFLEEALELVQACGCTQDEAHQLVDYVFGRPIGEPNQEVGGTMVTLAALCQAQGLDMDDDGRTELARVWTKVEKIRAKQAAKPKFGPLPERRCCRCTSGSMRPGVAMAETIGGMPDFVGHEVVTFSPGGPGKVIPCLKCSDCGHSETA